MSEPVYYHRGAMGDIVQSLPTVRVMGKGVYTTSMREDRHESVASLLRIQRCITDVRHVKKPLPGRLPEGTTVDLNRFLFGQGLAGKPLIDACLNAQGISLERSWEPWLDADVGWKKGNHHRLVLARTPRYRNPEAEHFWNTRVSEWISMFDETVFCGLESEYQDMRGAFPLVDWLETKNCYELARVVYESSLVICNQSLVFTLALGYGIKHMLEVAPGHTNCLYPTKTQVRMFGT